MCFYRVLGTYIGFLNKFALITLLEKLSYCLKTKLEMCSLVSILMAIHLKKRKFMFLILTASNGKNKELADSIKTIAEKNNKKCEIISLMDLKLPLYDTAVEEDGIPPKAEELADKLKKTNSFFILAPEYNGSIPPVLNNAIAWLSRTSDDWRECFNKKTVALGTHSGGGGHYVLLAMRQQLSYIGCNCLGRQIHTHYQKKLNEESVEEILKEFT